MQTNFPELRAWLYDQENFQTSMGKSAYQCSIQDSLSLTPCEILTANSRIQPSSVVVIMPDGSYKEFWQDVYDDQKNIPYGDRLAMYSASFLIT
jgi:hypothetical protein